MEIAFQLRVSPKGGGTVMHTADGQSVSVWMRDSHDPETDPLTENIETDLCVVGAGIAGLSVAHEMAREGWRVAVLDDGRIGGGQTQRTTAHLTCAIDDRFYRIERWHGHHGARLAAESHAAAIDRIEAIAGNEGIACDFSRRDGYLFNPPGKDPQELEKELAAAHRAGLTKVRMLARAPLES